MKLLLIVMMLSVLSGCGMYPQEASGNNPGYQDQVPTTGNGN